MKKFQNFEDLLRFLTEEDYKYVDFRFTDIDGNWKSISYGLKSLNSKMLEEGIPFDGSSIPTWQPIDKSDLLLKPDLMSSFSDPFITELTYVLFCDVYDIYKNEYYFKCPRTIAKKALKYLKDSNIGDVAYFGPENEFFIFDNVKICDEQNRSSFEIDSEDGGWNDSKEYSNGINTGHRVRSQGGYFPTSPVDALVDLRAEMFEVLEQVGLEPIMHHHEVGQGQCEIGVKFGTLLEAADNVQKLKYVVKNVAHLNGKTATFMPKPLYLDNGSGMHVHQSIFKNGKNLFYGSDYKNLSKTALNYLGGILKHAKALSAITNPSTNSFKRLRPGYEAPSILTYASNNRSASIRLPYGSDEKSVRIETRFPDNSSNPYLSFSALLMAGLDGIANDIEPEPAREENLFALSLDEIRAKGINQLPNTLRQALEELIGDHSFLSSIMGEEFIDIFQHHKFETQVWAEEDRPTPYEYKSTFSC